MALPGPQPEFRFGTKAETLACLAPLVTLSAVPALTWFTVRRWRAMPPAVLAEITQAFRGAALAIRSSAELEDADGASMAGVFRSRLGVPPAERAAAIDEVVAAGADRCAVGNATSTDVVTATTTSNRGRLARPPAAALHRAVSTPALRRPPAHSVLPTRLPPPRLLERVLSPGADAALLATLREWVGGRDIGRALDVGVGERSLLAAAGAPTIGLDLAPARARAFAAHGGAVSVAGNALTLPFRDAAFDAVVSIGLLHHLPDADARAVLREVVRVTRPSGSILIFDSVLPEPAWCRPLAWAIRRADRGRFVRREKDLGALLPDRASWRTRRCTYSRTGLEGLWCTRRAHAADER